MLPWGMFFCWWDHADFNDWLAWQASECCRIRRGEALLPRAEQDREGAAIDPHLVGAQPLEDDVRGTEWERLEHDLVQQIDEEFVLRCLRALFARRVDRLN